MHLENDDVSADIRSAIEGLNSDAGRVEAPSAPVADAPAPLEEPQAPVETKAQAARDDHGRFAPKEDKGAKDPEVPVQAAEPEQPTELSIPRSLSPEAKAAFKEWPELARNEFLRREADTARGVEKLQQELRSVSERYQPLEAVIAPHREKWQLHGMDEARAVQALVAAQNFLEKDPVSGIAYLARQYGVQLGQVDPSATPAPQADPQVIQLHQKIQTLEQRLQAQDQASQSQRLNETQSAIEQFASDPKHLYFDNVRGDMAKLIESGAAVSLPDAYQKACWSNETIRNLMLAEQQRGVQADEATRRQQHAQQARQAAGSIAGSAGPGATRALDTDPSASIEDDIRRSMQQLAGRV